MNVPSEETLKKMAPASILNFKGTPKEVTRHVKNGVGPGRYSHGVHLEDLAYLITKYNDAVESRQVKEGKSIPLSDYQSLFIQQMMGIPARKITRGLNTDAVAAKMEQYFNTLQDDWKFSFSVHASPGTRGIMSYSVMYVKLVGGNEEGLGGLFDL